MFDYGIRTIYSSSGARYYEVDIECRDGQNIEFSILDPHELELLQIAAQGLAEELQETLGINEYT